MKCFEINSLIREVEVVVEVFIKLLAFNDIKSIGIITPYDAQRKRLRNEINLQAKVILYSS